MISVLIEGKLHADPIRRTSAKGRHTSRGKCGRRVMMASGETARYAGRYYRGFALR